MKKAFLVIWIMGIASVLNAQGESVISDEDLSKYAQVMVWAELEKNKITEIYNDWINKDENLTAILFVKIKAAKGDSAKLSEIAVSQEELQSFNQIEASYDSLTSAFKNAYVGRIKEDVGAGVYNRVKKSLGLDAAVKARYQLIFNKFMNESKDAIKEDEMD